MPDLSPLLELADLGLTAEQYAGVLRVISVMVRDAEVTASVTLERNADERATNKSADRQRRYRERVKSGAHNAATVTRDVTRYAEDLSPIALHTSPSASPSPQKETLPTPLKENNPSPPLTPPPARSNERGTRLPSPWVLPDEWAAWCREQWPTMPDAFIARQSSEFADYWHSLPGSKGRKVDWLATWRRWIREAVDRQRERGARGQAPPGRMTQADAGRIATEFFRKQAEEGEDDEQSGTGEGERGDRSDAAHLLGRPV